MVGAGAAGMAAAWRLGEGGAEVVLFEAEREPGGHVMALAVDGVEIDVGVTDFNVDSFHGVRGIFEALELRWGPIGQDASFASPEGRAAWWVRDGAPCFREGVADPPRLWAEVERFNRSCVEVLREARFATRTAGAYLAERGYGPDLRASWFVPRAGGCFPMPACSPEDFLIRAIVAFWHVHGIVGEPGRRMVLDGGMLRWPRAFAQRFRGELRLGSRVLGLARGPGGVRVGSQGPDGLARDERFDQVVVATNSNQVLPLFEDLTHAQATAFAGQRWQRARVFVHRDPSLMPDAREAWGAYNYVLGDAPRPTITFWPRALSRRPELPEDVLVTVNPHRPPAHVLAARFLVHPAVDRPREISNQRIEALQGVDRTWYAGGWLLTPHVHEQAFQSGWDVAGRILASDAARPPRRARDFVDFVRTVPLFSAIDPCLLEEVGLAATPFAAPAGTTLFRQGDTPDALLLVEEGAVRVEREGRALGRMERGGLVGEMALIDGGARTADAVVERALRGWRIDRARFMALRDDDRPGVFAVSNTIGLEVARRLRTRLEGCAGVCLRSEALLALFLEGRPPLDGLALLAFRDGEPLLERGEHPTRCVCVREGRVGAGRFSVGPGGLVGLSSALLGEPSGQRFVAEGEVLGLALPVRTLLDVRAGRLRAPRLFEALDRALVGWHREVLAATPG